MLLLLLLLSRFSRVLLCATPWTAVHQAPLSMGFSRQEYWSGVPLLSPPCKDRLRLLSLLLSEAFYAMQGSDMVQFTQLVPNLLASSSTLLFLQS